MCNHGNDWNAHYGDGRELPGELDHEEQGSNKNHQIPKEKINHQLAPSQLFSMLHLYFKELGGPRPLLKISYLIFNHYTLPKKDVEIECNLVRKLGCIGGQSRGQISRLNLVKESNVLMQQSFE